MPQLKSQIDSLYADIKRKISNIQKIERDLYSECMKYYPSDRELAVYGPGGGKTLLDTGCISGSKTVPITLSGESDTVTVIVKPACEKKGTNWNFKIECPESSAGQVATTTGSGSGKTSSAPTVIAELINQSKDNTHIFVEGQENFGLQNKLAPFGGNRKVSISVPVQGGRIKLISGRNGQKLAECLWDYTPDSKSRVPVVTFYEPNRLSCVTGLR